MRTTAAHRQKLRKKLEWTTPKGAALRLEIYAAADFSCEVCGRRFGVPDGYDGRRALVDHTSEKLVYLAVDHVRAVLHGGTNERSNLRALCSSCNGSKGVR